MIIAITTVLQMKVTILAAMVIIVAMEIKKIINKYLHTTDEKAAIILILKEHKEKIKIMHNLNYVCML